MAHYELYLLGLLGIVIHYLKDFETHRKQGKKYSLPSLLPTILLSIITTGTLIYLKDAIAELYVITPFAAVILGYFGNSVFFSFINAKNPLGNVNAVSDSGVIINEVYVLPDSGVVGQWYHFGNNYYYWNGSAWIALYEDLGPGGGTNPPPVGLPPVKS